MRALKFRISFAILLYSLVFPLTELRAQEDSQAWSRIAEGLELSRFNVKPESIFYAQISAVRSSLKKYRAAVLRAQDFGYKSADARTLCQKSHALVCINASFFDEQGRPLGLLISRGVIRHQMHNAGRTLTGVLQVTRDAVSIVHRSSFAPEKVIEAVQAGPRLLAKGVEIKAQQTEVSRRSGVCLDKSGHLIVFAVTSTFSGVSIPELQKILKSEPLNCVDALNFDGGGSTQLYISSELPGAASGSQELYIPGRDEVPVMLALFVK